MVPKWIKKNAPRPSPFFPRETHPLLQIMSPICQGDPVHTLMNLTNRRLIGMLCVDLCGSTKGQVHLYTGARFINFILEEIKLC